VDGSRCDIWPSKKGRGEVTLPKAARRGMRGKNLRSGASMMPLRKSSATLDDLSDVRRVVADKLVFGVSSHISMIFADC
jgi:hypothetical protein